MNRDQFNLGKAPQISIESCHSDLVIRSWGDAMVLVKGTDYEATETEAGMTLSSNGKLSLMVPEGASLVVQQVNGDLVVKHVQGAISVQEVNGDVVLSGVNEVSLGTVHSDVSARNLNGRFEAAHIHGDAAFRNVQSVSAQIVHGDTAVRNVDGDVHMAEVMGDTATNTISGDLLIEKCHRDVMVRNIGGEVLVKHAAGDIRLYGTLSQADHNLQADGDIVVRWPVDGAMNLVAAAPKIRNRLPLENVQEEPGSLTGQLGDGSVNVNLSAGGEIVLKEMRLVSDEWDDASDSDFDISIDLVGLTERLNEQVMAQVSRVTSELENKFGPDFATTMAEKVARKAEKAAARAEQAAERARRRAEQRSGYRRTSSPPKPSAPPKPRATPEEQIKILKMVEQGLITPEEANVLLEALEG